MDLGKIAEEPLGDRRRLLSVQARWSRLRLSDRGRCREPGWRSRVERPAELGVAEVGDVDVGVMNEAVDQLLGRLLDSPAAGPHLFTRPNDK